MLSAFAVMYGTGLTLRAAHECHAERRNASSTCLIERLLVVELQPCKDNAAHSVSDSFRTLSKYADRAVSARPHMRHGGHAASCPHRGTGATKIDCLGCVLNLAPAVADNCRANVVYSRFRRNGMRSLGITWRISCDLFHRA
jgi:hypothetical protein